ncbi:MAG: filamentous hemagglutinin N-terminal domain-containing protein [Thermosynechococcaceae cyanobacterium MS004]|nr:filamentous hemagglutinin N-terminal domain-containing protein [Thermosynechococcaceae cyanobacterium MS004]
MSSPRNIQKLVRACILSFTVSAIAVESRSWTRASWAQVIPDNTLGNESSTVRQDIPIQGKGVVGALVEGGAIRGINLFHSFTAFNVSETGLFFAVPSSASIDNIVSRVTGKNPSQISGKLGVLGDANLFLINPNGIIFGANASLDVRGSFVATTANSMQFGDQGFFDASVPNAIPLLTVHPTAFFFSRPNAAPIVNESTQSVGSRTTRRFVFPIQKDLFGLRVADHKSLLLLGGDVTLNQGGLNALEGRIEIGSISGVGTVALTKNGNDLRLGVPPDLSLGNILLSSGAALDASGEGGGGIFLKGNNIRLIDSEILSETLGSQNGEGLVIEASHDLELLGANQDSTIFLSTSGSGNAGKFELTARNLLVKDGSQVLTTSLGDGKGGNLTINAENLVEISGFSTFLGFPFGSALVSSALAKGDGGNIVIQAKDLIIRDRAAISTNSSGIFLPDGSTTTATGNAGNLSITTTESVQLFGSNSVIDLATFDDGAAGNLEISTKKLLVKDGSSILLVTRGPSPGGNVKVTATESILVSGKGSNISAASVRGSGSAGSITLNTAALEVNDGADITVTSPKAKAGLLKITANTIALNQGSLLAETGQSGAVDGVNILLNTSDLIRLENESLISATAGNDAMGGSITFNTPLLVVFPPTGANGSDVVAKASQGKGGNITVNAQGIFGIQERIARPDNQTNDFDASSEFGAPGQVRLNVEEGLSEDLVELPSTVVDPNALVAQSPCRRGTKSALTRSGRGGFAPTLGEDWAVDATQVGLVAPVAPSQARAVPSASAVRLSSPSASPAVSTTAIAQPVVPAEGWMFNQAGEVVLVAHRPVENGAQRLKAVPPGCPIP